MQFLLPTWRQWLPLLSCWLLLPACQPPPTAPRLNLQQTSLTVSDSVPTDAAVAQLILPYKQQLEAEMSEIVGYSARELTKQKVESTLGNFVADLLLEASKKQWGDTVDLSLVTTGGLRIPLPAGPIRLGTVYELMPFENRLALVKLTGSQVQQLFNYAARYGNAAIGNSRFKVSGQQAVDISIGGAPLNPTATYLLSTYDYLAWGGDNMEFMREASILEHSDILFRDAILAKFRALKASNTPADAAIEGRVIILN